LNAAVFTYFRAYQRATDPALEFDRCAPAAIWRGPSRLQTTQEAAHSAIFCELLRYMLGTAEHEACRLAGGVAAAAEAAVHRASTSTARKYFTRRSLGWRDDGGNRPNG